MRRTVLSGMAAGIAVGGVFIGLVAAGAFGSGPVSQEEPPAKQALETAQAHRDATAQSVAPAPKTSRPAAPPTRSSCPIDPNTITTEVTGVIHQPPPSPIFAQITLLNEATAVTADGVPYSLFFGVSDTDNQQGIVVVWQGVKDPCAAGGRTSLDPQEYLVPARGTFSGFTSIDQSLVTFAYSGGQSGEFNYVSKVFVGAKP